MFLINWNYIAASGSVGETEYLFSFINCLCQQVTFLGCLVFFFLIGVWLNQLGFGVLWTFYWINEMSLRLKVQDTRYKAKSLKRSKSAKRTKYEKQPLAPSATPKTRTKYKQARWDKGQEQNRPSNRMTENYNTSWKHKKLDKIWERGGMLDKLWNGARNISHELNLWVRKFEHWLLENLREVEALLKLSLVPGGAQHSSRKS